MNIINAKKAIDKVIKKARVHLYKPIQVAEILHRDRISKDIDLVQLATYRTTSRKWRDKICLQFLGRTSTSSARYQDDLFNKNAVPPEALIALGEENRAKNGIVEAYIYYQFAKRFTQMSDALNYTQTHDKSNFELATFINLFWKEAGLRRSIDKIYEIVAYALFSAIIEALELSITVEYNPKKKSLLKEFEDFAEKVINLNSDIHHFVTTAKIYRVGVTNAADRGLDMWASFGLAIQVKHLSLSEKIAKDIVSSVTADRIVIVCKKAEKSMIVSLLGQLGWKARIQSIVTENNLISWYEKAMRGKHHQLLGDRILEIISNEIELEFPVTKSQEFEKFYQNRNYHTLKDDFWM